MYAILLLLTLASAALHSGAANDIPISTKALSADDECEPGDDTCSMNALQFMARKAQSETNDVPSWCQYVPDQYQQTGCRGTSSSGCTCDDACKQIPSNTWSYNPQCCGCAGGNGTQSLVSEVDIPSLPLAVPAWCQYVPSSQQQAACRGTNAKGCTCKDMCAKDIPANTWMWNPECCGCGASAPASLAASAVIEQACSCDQSCVVKPGNLWRYDTSCCGCGEGANSKEASEMNSAIGNVLLLPQALGAPAWCQYVPNSFQQAACRGTNAQGCTCDGFCQQIPANSWQWNPQCCGCGGGKGAKALLSVPEVSDFDSQPSALQIPAWCQYVPNAQTIPVCAQGPGGVTGMPGSQTIPGMPGATGGSSIPGIPGVSSVPGVPSGSSIPGLPGATGGSSIPGLPGATSGSTIPGIPGLSTLDESTIVTDSEGDQCHDGLVGKVYAYAPSCLSSCPSACGPLGKAITAYMAHGGQPAAKKVVCAHKEAFACAVSPANLPKCKPLIDKAAGFGFALPHSDSELESQCQ